MAHRIAIAPDVLAQLLAASSYYDEAKDGLGIEFEDEVQLLLTSIANNPQLYPLDHARIRRALVRRFHHHVYYAVEGDVVVVLEFRDARRAPPQR